MESPSSDVPRYYRSPREGEVTGPFTRAEIDAAVARGEIGSATLLCLDGTTDWRPAAELLFGMRSGAGDGPIPAGARGRSVGIGGPIVATVLSLLACCLPIGVIPLILASIANGRYAAGDFDGGMRAERQAKGWLVATWVLLAIGCAINAWTSYAMLDAFERLLSGGLPR